MANYYDLSGHSTRIGWYPAGKGGPVVAGGPPANAPVLIYSNGSSDVSVWGDDLRVGPLTGAGTFVVGVVNRAKIVPGGISSFGVLIPDVVVDASPVSVHTIGVLAVHRGTAQLGPGQLETYTEVALKGTAANVILPAVVPAAPAPSQK
jgi:hypothetical protein